MNRTSPNLTMQSMQTQPASQSPIGLIIRLVAYFLFPTACVFIFSQVTIMYNSADPVFKENTLVEWSQVIVLLTASLCLYRAYRQQVEMKAVFLILMLLPLIAVSRELDSFFKFIDKGFWKVPVAVVSACVLYCAYKHRAALPRQVQVMIFSRSFMLMFAGFTIVMGFSRLIGQRALMQAVMQENYVRMAARVIEESCEFVGYCLILAGAFECLYERFTTRPSRPPAGRELP